MQITRRGENELHLDGFPDAIKLIRVDGPKAQLLADLALHRSDLRFADDSLQAIQRVAPEEDRIRTALWRVAVIYYCKCFGQSESRRSLIASKVYKGHPASNLEAFGFFQQLRDKHLVHDENSSSQCPVGAAINGGNKQHKVEGVVPIVHTFGVEGPENYRNLQVLIEVATAWVATEYDKVLDSIKDDLERVPYGELVSRPVLQVVVPTIEDMGKKRP